MQELYGLSKAELALTNELRLQKEVKHSFRDESGPLSKFCEVTSVTHYWNEQDSTQRNCQLLNWISECHNWGFLNIHHRNVKIKTFNLFQGHTWIHSKLVSALATYLQVLIQQPCPAWQMATNSISLSNTEFCQNLGQKVTIWSIWSSYWVDISTLKKVILNEFFN